MRPLSRFHASGEILHLYKQVYLGAQRTFCDLYLLSSDEETKAQGHLEGTCLRSQS